MKKIILALYLLIILTSTFSLSLNDLDIRPELYDKAFLTINLKRIHIYSSFGNIEKCKEIIEILKKFDAENSKFYNYLLKETTKNSYVEEVKRDNNGFIDISESSTIKKIILMAERENNIIKKIQLYKSILVNQPYNEEIKIEIGKCYIELKRYFTARKWFLKVDSKKSSQYIEKIDYLLNKTVTIMEVSGEKQSDTKRNEKEDIYIEELISKGKKDEAIKELTKKSIKEPANFKYLYSIAKIYSDNNEYRKSLEYIDKVIILNSELYEALYLKGELLSKIGNFPEALVTFKKIANSAPENTKYYRLANNMIKLLSSTY
ncbi:MAG: hypothetical protein M0R46_02290 [Candidatus Muirbacterium halophilum]|nr:hypothetical protein [Candidatus Muirbacterium halophilum]MCK9474719.1 hypothetical protein [Candidatus Muirbacterium halophilum]